MVLDMTSMKIDLFWENWTLQYDYTFDPTSGVYVGIELIPFGTYHWPIFDSGPI